MSEPAEQCKCGEPGLQPHTCPFKADTNDDYESLCVCCEKCISDCCDEV